MDSDSHEIVWSSWSMILLKAEYSMGFLGTETQRLAELMMYYRGGGWFYLGTLVVNNAIIYSS